jgi:hypothetical protein
MNFGLLGQITVCVIVGSFSLNALHKWYHAKPQAQTVENEQDETRAVVAHTANWQGVTTQTEADDHCCEDVPQDLILRHIREVA